MTMITPSYLGETIEYSSLHACRSTLEDPTPISRPRPNGRAHRSLLLTRPRGLIASAALGWLASRLAWPASPSLPRSRLPLRREVPAGGSRRSTHPLSPLSLLTIVQ